MERLDLVIFGATGFTGKKAVEEIIRLTEKDTSLTWGVAGRSQKKLWKLMEGVSKTTGVDHSKVKLIIADINDEHTLRNMCSQAKVVVNCCGPYQLYGEPVVRACVESGTHYVDVSGEVQFIEKMQLQYDALARDAGVYVISACGLDSVPNDMGVVYLQENFDGTLNSVESYLSLYLPVQYLWQVIRYGAVHYGTWQSFMLILAHWSELRPMRQKIYSQRLPRFEPKLQRRFFYKNDYGYNIALPIADNSVVYRTQRYLYEHENKRPAQFRAYVTIPSLIFAVGLLIGLALWSILCQFEFTRKLLMQYPRIFSFGVVGHGGPTEKVMNNSYFKTILYGEGWSKDVDIRSNPPNKKVMVEVTGVNPGYGATVTALILSAVTVLKEQDKMPSTGGVLTTGAAFYNTDYIKNLNANNFKFKIVDSNIRN